MIVGLSARVFVMIVGPKMRLFASPRHTVCKPLQLSGGANTFRLKRFRKPVPSQALPGHALWRKAQEAQEDVIRELIGLRREHRGRWSGLIGGMISRLRVSAAGVMAARVLMPILGRSVSHVTMRREPQGIVARCVASDGSMACRPGWTCVSMATPYYQRCASGGRYRRHRGHGL
jgi:hypothetical protein